MKSGFKFMLCITLAIVLPITQLYLGAGEKKISGATGMTINENAIYRIVNKSTGKVIDVTNASSDNGTLLQSYSSNGTAAQQFKFIPSVSEGYYCIVPMCAKTKAFDDPSYSRESGKVHQIYQQNGEGAQDYQITDAGNGYVRIISKPSGFALTDTGSIAQYAVADDDRQLWKLEVVRSTNCFTNPIRYDGADPWVFKAGNSYYYCQSSGGVALYKMNDLTQLGIAQYNNIFQNDYVGSETLSSYWAPECIYLQGHWYSYFAPEVNRGGNDSHRTYVLQGGTNPNNPLDGAYTLKGRLADSTNKWSIDTTAFEYNGRLYCVWSGWEGDTNVAQNIYIAEMSNPWTISSNRVCISRPTYSWETNTNPQVNEGPEVLIKNGKVHIIYSASGSWTDSYCLGRLTCTNGDFLNPSAWSKGSEPVFQQTSTVHGVGHASFVQSPDGTEDWIVYHAAKRSGGGWDRDIHMQLFTWHDDYPFFGTPVSNDVELGNPSKSYSSPVNENHYYVVKNVATGRCLDIPNGEDKNSLQLQTWTINNTNAQQFKFTQKSTGWFTMSPKCAPTRGLDNPVGSTGTGVQYQTWDLNNNKAQNFRLEKVADGTYRIINQASLYALTDNGERANYKVTQEALTNDNNQRWELIDRTAAEETTTAEPTTKAPETTTEEPTTKTPETTTEEPMTEETPSIHIVNTGLTVDGYQISPTLNGFRTVYSVEPTIEGKDVVEIGLVYALKDYINDKDMYVRDDHPYVKNYASTKNLSDLFTDTARTTNHSMTMLFAHYNLKEFSTNMAIRAYAKLSDNSYVYTNIYNYTIYRVADVLYSGNYFKYADAHNYLYNRILKVVNPQYKENPFNYANTLVK